MPRHDLICSLFDGCWVKKKSLFVLAEGEFYLQVMKKIRTFDVIPILCLKRIEPFLLCKMQEHFSAVLDLLESFLFCSWWKRTCQWYVSRKNEKGGWGGIYSIEKSLLLGMLSWWLSWIHLVASASYHHPAYFINHEKWRDVVERRKERWMAIKPDWWLQYNQENPKSGGREDRILDLSQFLQGISCNCECPTNIFSEDEDDVAALYLPFPWKWGKGQGKERRRGELTSFRFCVKWILSDEIVLSENYPKKKRESTFEFRKGIQQSLWEWTSIGSQGPNSSLFEHNNWKLLKHISRNHEGERKRRNKQTTNLMLNHINSRELIPLVGIQRIKSFGLSKFWKEFPSILNFRPISIWFSILFCCLCRTNCKEKNIRKGERRWYTGGGYTQPLRMELGSFHWLTTSSHCKSFLNRWRVGNLGFLEVNKYPWCLKVMISPVWGFHLFANSDDPAVAWNRTPFGLIKGDHLRELL